MPLPTDPRPLPSLLIYDFEGQLEDAITETFKQMLATYASQINTTPGAANMAAFQAQQNNTLTTPRIEVMYESGQQEQKQYRVPGTGNVAKQYQDGWAYQNWWNGRVTIRIATNRQKDNTNPANPRAAHRLYRAMVRVMMMMSETVNENLESIGIWQALESATSPVFMQSNEEDRSAISFQLKIEILGSSFPVPSM